MFRPHLLLLVAALDVPAWVATAEIRPKRAASDTSVDRWSNKRPIPYVISSDFTSTQREIIKDTVKKFSDDICLDFELNGQGAGTKITYNLVTSGACDGAVVPFNQTFNPLNSTIRLRDYCVNRQAIIHETMHTLGFRHTQCRNDRDNYVRVAPIVQTSSNYAKLAAEDFNDYGTPYEYNALLHYSLNGNMTIIDEDYKMSVHGDFLTFNELKMINLRYNCTEKCTSKLDCKNGGYQHPRKCNECVCPQFYKGTLCNEEKGVVNLKLGVPEPLSHSFPGDEALKTGITPELFSMFQQSTPLLIKAPAGTKIKVDITQLNDPFNFNRFDCNDFGAEIVDGDLTRVGKRFCILPQTGRSFVSETNVVGFLVYALPGYSFGATVTFTAVGTPTGTTTTEAPVVTTTTTTAPPPTTTTTTKAPVVTTTTAPLPITTTTTKAPPVITTTTPSTSTGGAWCDA